MLTPLQGALKKHGVAEHLFKHSDEMKRVMEAIPELALLPLGEVAVLWDEFSDEVHTTWRVVNDEGIKRFSCWLKGEYYDPAS